MTPEQKIPVPTLCLHTSVSRMKQNLLLLLFSTHTMNTLIAVDFALTLLYGVLSSVCTCHSIKYVVRNGGESLHFCHSSIHI